jgi:energy-coupling factor transport system substrate-specific component
MASIEKTVFISYRRVDVYVALAVYQHLTSHGYDVFFDYTSIPSGDFEQIILSNIKARAHFILILTPNALDRCSEKGDWLRREIETGIDEKRNIVPLFFKGFSFGSPSISSKLTGKLGNINRYNGLNVHEDYFYAAMERLCEQFLNIPLDAVLHPVSTEVQSIVKKEQSAADKAILDIKDLEGLAKEEINEQSIKELKAKAGKQVGHDIAKRVVPEKRENEIQGKAKPVKVETTEKRKTTTSSLFPVIRDFNNFSFVLIPIGIIINILIGQIAVLLKLPVFLDSVGTVLVGIICGPWAGALTGVFANTIWGLFNTDSLPWWPVALFIGLVAGLCANAGLFKSWWQVILSGFLIALTAAIVSTPIAVYLYGGITASGSSFIAAYLMQIGQGVLSAVFSTGFLVEPVDKIATAMFAFAIVQSLSKHLITRFPRPENAELEEGNNTPQLTIALVAFVVVLLLGFVVRNILAS